MVQHPGDTVGWRKGIESICQADATSWFLWLKILWGCQSRTGGSGGPGGASQDRDQHDWIQLDMTPEA